MRPVFHTLVFVALVMTGCGSGNPTPPESAAPLGTTKADGRCQYPCAKYHYTAGLCFQGWVCNAAGQLRPAPRRLRWND
jgi:hypothetical protein